LAIHLRRGADLRQHRHGNTDHRADLLVPLEGVEVHQQGAAGVRHVGDVQPAVGSPGEVPDEPGVDVAETQIAGFGLLRRTLDVVEDPADLRAGEVGGEGQTGLVTEPVLPAVLAELVDDLVRPGVLPDDGVVNGLAGVAVPHHRRLPLVGDADGGDVGDVHAPLLQRPVDDLLGAVPDLLRVVLHPAGLGVDLVVFVLVDRHDLAAVVEDHAAGAGRSLVDSGYVLGHSSLLLLSQLPQASAAAASRRCDDVAPGSWWPALRSPRQLALPLRTTSGIAASFPRAAASAAAAIASPTPAPEATASCRAA